jgi:hypothetical protein
MSKAISAQIQDKKKIIIAKDEIIDDLKQKINNIQMTNDSVIQLTLDKFNQNLNLKKLE